MPLPQEGHVAFGLRGFRAPNEKRLCVTAYHKALGMTPKTARKETPEEFHAWFKENYGDVLEAMGEAE